MFEQLSLLPTVVSVIFRSIFGDVTSSRWFESWGGSRVAQTFSSLVDLCFAFSRKWYPHTWLLLEQFMEMPILRELNLKIAQLQATIQNGMNRRLSQFAKEENGSIFVYLRESLISIISESNIRTKLLMCMIVLVGVVLIAYMFHFIISRNSNVLDRNHKTDDSLKSMDAKAKYSSLTSHLRFGNPGRGKASLSKPISPTVVPLTSVALSKLATTNLTSSSSHQSVDSHLSTPPRERGPHMTSDPGDERENDMARFTNLTGVSTLTPDSGFREIAWRMELNDEDQSGSEQHGSSSSSSYDSLHRGSDGPLNPSSVLQRSIKDPSALISWRIYVDKFGLGTIVGIRRKKFATTKFEVQFDNGQLHKLALKRSSNKGKVPFTLIKKIG